MEISPKKMKKSASVEKSKFEALYGNIYLSGTSQRQNSEADEFGGEAQSMKESTQSKRPPIVPRLSLQNLTPTSRRAERQFFNSQTE